MADSGAEFRERLLRGFVEEDMADGGVCDHQDWNLNQQCSPVLESCPGSLL